MDPTKLKVVELRHELQERGLETKGNKPVLVDRLNEALQVESGGTEGTKTPIEGKDIIEDDDITEMEDDSTRCRSRRNSTRKLSESSICSNQEDGSNVSRRSVRKKNPTGQDETSVETLQQISELPETPETGVITCGDIITENGNLTEKSGSVVQTNLDVAIKETELNTEIEPITTKPMEDEATVSKLEDCTGQTVGEMTENETVTKLVIQQTKESSKDDSSEEQDEPESSKTVEEELEDDDDKEEIDDDKKDQTELTKQNDTELTDQEEPAQADQLDSEAINAEVPESTNEDKVESSKDDQVESSKDDQVESSKDDQVELNNEDQVELNNQEEPESTDQDDDYKMDTDANGIKADPSDNTGQSFDDYTSVKQEKDFFEAAPTFDVNDVKQEDARTDEVKDEPVVKEENVHQDEESRRGEKRRSRSRSRSPYHKRPRSDYNAAPIENEPEFDMSVVALDWYNCDLSLEIDQETRLEVTPIVSQGFGYVWHGAKATFGFTHGRIWYEATIKSHLDVPHLEAEEAHPHVVRVGWSTDDAGIILGEEEFSYGYGGTGMASTNLKFKKYGTKFQQGDVLACFLDLEVEPIVMSFTVNGKHQGLCYEIEHGELKGQALFPHILTKNCSLSVNFGTSEPAFEPLSGYTIAGEVSIDDRTLISQGPEKRSECEVIMMVGLPACGKTTWVEEYCNKNRVVKYNVLGTNNLLDKMKVMGLPRKNNYHGRWEVLIERSTKCLNKLLELSYKRRRNFIIDQTNVYPSARRRKMKGFAGYKQRAVVICPTDDELKRRFANQGTVEGKQVPENAIYEMKANFKLPEEGDSFCDIEYVELTKEESEKQVEDYNKEALDKGYKPHSLRGRGGSSSGGSGGFRGGGGRRGDNRKEGQYRGGWERDRDRRGGFDNRDNWNSRDNRGYKDNNDRGGYNRDRGGYRNNNYNNRGGRNNYGGGRDNYGARDSYRNNRDNYAGRDSYRGGRDNNSRGGGRDNYGGAGGGGGGRRDYNHGGGWGGNRDNQTSYGSNDSYGQDRSSGGYNRDTRTSTYDWNKGQKDSSQTTSTSSWGNGGQSQSMSTASNYSSAGYNTAAAAAAATGTWGNQGWGASAQTPQYNWNQQYYQQQSGYWPSQQGYGQQGYGQTTGWGTQGAAQQWGTASSTATSSTTPAATAAAAAAAAAVPTTNYSQYNAYSNTSNTYDRK